ncbi:MAG: NAD(P)/FAD-dependent oxidoreductase [Myxococcota bacterium]
MQDGRPTVVIGAGVVGLAIARRLALWGREVVVIEAAERVGTGVTSRNSEVVHAGIYYPPGSLKARMCVRGKQLLYTYAAETGIPHRRTGKLVVATSDGQLPRLNALWANAQASGVTDLCWLDEAAVRDKEPALHCVAGLWSPSSGIVDSHALTNQLEADLLGAGGVVVLHTRALSLHAGPDGPVVRTVDGEVEADAVYLCAGLDTLALARTCLPPAVLPPSPSHLAKGTYYALTGVAPPFRHLVYPLPEAAGLGIHATVDLVGQVRFGPDVEWVETRDVAPRAHREDQFYASVRQYWPDLPDGSLVASYAGLRPKIVGPGEPSADFVVLGPPDHGVNGVVALLGIESPGLTAALALAEYVTSDRGQAD